MVIQYLSNLGEEGAKRIYASIIANTLDYSEY